MENLETIHLKTKEMLRCFGQKKTYPGFVLFPNKKAGLKERKQLRRQLIDQIKNHKDFKKDKKDFNWNNLLKIGQKPDCPFVSISISHCNSLGGFLFAFDKTISIGFDIEQRIRITEKIIERISLKEEIDQAPNLSLLWVAKEASLKCLSDNKARLLLKDCLISNWKKEPTKEIYFFDCYSKKNKKKAFGTAGSIGDLSLAYAERKIIS